MRVGRKGGSCICQETVALGSEVFVQTAVRNRSRERVQKISK